jgi:hypothetical protein
MDALSDVLGAIRLTGAVFFDVHASEPWVAETPSGRQIVHRIFPHAEHLIPYHAVVSGSCWVMLPGVEPLQLATGDVVMFPHGHPHVLTSTHSPPMRDSFDSASAICTYARSVPAVESRTWIASGNAISSGLYGRASQPR